MELEGIHVESNHSPNISESIPRFCEMFFLFHSHPQMMKTQTHKKQKSRRRRRRRRTRRRRRRRRKRKRKRKKEEEETKRRRSLSNFFPTPLESPSFLHHFSSFWMEKQTRISSLEMLVSTKAASGPHCVPQI